jgi:hypothetical protein
MAGHQPAQSPPPEGRKAAHPIANINTSRSPPAEHPLMRAPSSPQMGSHRTSLAENLRGNPTSPRTAHRTPSLSQQALQDLLNNPPTAKTGTDEFAGRDWRSIKVGEVVDLELVRFVEMDTSVEEATNVCALYKKLGEEFMR